MSTEPSCESDAVKLITKNEALVTYYYKLAAFFLLGLMLCHTIFAALLLVLVQCKDTSQVLQFVAFNATVLVIEVFISRIAFMLGSRSGQLRDLRFILVLASQGIDPATLESLSRAVMSLRRDVSGLKVVDLESLAAVIQKK